MRPTSWYDTEAEPHPSSRRGWRSAPLGTIAEVRVGMHRSPQRASGPAMTPYLRAANVTWDGLDLTDVKEMSFTAAEKEVYLLRRGDLLVSEASGSAAEVGKPAIWSGEIAGCCFQNTLIRVRPPPGTTRFFYFQLLYLARSGAFGDASKGVGIHHLGAERFSRIEVRIAPRGEQDRIVLAIEQHLSLIDAAVKGLRRVLANLGRYRASVLLAACEGRLVPLEADLARREKRDHEPAAALLGRIASERRRAVKVSDTSGLPRLPRGWQWTTLRDIADIRGGLTKGRKRDPERLRKVPYLRVANVQRGYLDLSEMKEIEATEQEIEDLALRRGDVLFNEGGDRDKLGRGWVWEGALPECIHQNHVFRARLSHGLIEPKFVSHYGNSCGRSYFAEQGQQTTNLASINIAKLGALPLPIPPLAEQRRIVAEVERLLAAAEITEQAVRAQLLRAGRLRQSVLRRAFEGELLGAAKGDLARIEVPPPEDPGHVQHLLPDCPEALVVLSRPAGRRAILR